MIASLFLALVVEGATQQGEPDAFGDHIACGEDLDGDGLADLVASAHVDGDLPVPKLIALSGKDGRALWHCRLLGAEARGVSIRALEFIRDQDGDHVAEIAVVLGSRVGNDELRICSGETGKLLASHARPAGAESIVVPLRDVDGDGIPESVSLSSNTRLRICTWFGGRVDRTVDIRSIVLAPAPDLAVEPIPDVNADGIGDLIVGLPWSGKHSLVFVVSGSDGKVLRHIQGMRSLSEQDGLGSDVGRIGDFDGDGSPDFVAASNMTGMFWDGQTYAQVVSAKTGEILFAYPNVGEAAGRVFYSACGDINRDGNDDVLFAESGSMGSWPQVVLVSGKTHRVLRRWGGTEVRDGCLYAEFNGKRIKAIQASADLDGDGVRDLVVALAGPAQGLASIRTYSMKDGRLLREFIQLPE